MVETRDRESAQFARALAQARSRLDSVDSSALVASVRELCAPYDLVGCHVELCGAGSARRVVAPPESAHPELDAVAARVQRRGEPESLALASTCWCVFPIVDESGCVGSLALGFSDAPTLAHVGKLVEPHCRGLQSTSTAAFDLAAVSAIAQTLQSTLLPSALPTGEWFDLAALYVPSAAELEVGGDWYDAQILDDGTLAMSVGDVAGHGPEAAARMGELRSATTALRLVQRSPGDLIAVLHRLTLRTGYFATAICVRVEPRGALVWSSAGHLPPLVVSRNGEVGVLSEAHSPPLGVGYTGDVPTNRRQLSPGDLVLLYTDGLVERRGEPLNESIGRLAAFVAEHSGADPAALVERLVDSLGQAGSAPDDIAVLVGRWEGPPAEYAGTPR